MLAALPPPPVNAGAVLISERPQSGCGPPRDPAAAAAALLATPGDSSNQPRMTLAADIANNSLIVTAPVQLAEEVERLARTLDSQMQWVNEASAEVTRVIPSSSACLYLWCHQKAARRNQS